MATQTLRPADVAYTISGNNPYTLVHPEAASQTFKRGAMLTLDAAGRVIESTSPNPVRILGVAEADAANDSVAGNSNSRVQVADDDTVWKMNVSTSQVTALTDLGKIYGIIKVGNNWHVDRTAEGANGRVIVVGFHDTELGDTQGRLLVIFSQRYSLLTVTS